MGFSDHGFYGQKFIVPRLCADCTEKEGLGHVYDGPSCSQQHSDWYCNPMVTVLLWFLAMKNIAIAGLGVTYIRSTGEHASATIVGPSTRGDDFIHLKYMRNGTDSDSELLTSADSSSCSDSGEDDEVQLVWATAARGIWGLGHVFDDKLYFTNDIVDDSLVPKNRKPKPISKPAAKPAPKPAPKGKHVQLFKMKRKVGKGFYSVPADGQ